MNGNQVDNDKQVNNQNSIITRRTVTIFGIFVCAFLLITQIEAVKNVFSWLAKTLTPVLMGAIFAYIINPVFVYFERQTNTFWKNPNVLNPAQKTVSPAESVFSFRFSCFLR